MQESLEKGNWKGKTVKEKQKESIEKRENEKIGEQFEKGGAIKEWDYKWKKVKKLKQSIFWKQKR